MMKGVVFRQFLEFAEKEFGEAKIDELLRTTDLESAGVYTNVGYYDHVEMLTLVTALSNQTGRSARQLLVGFGRSLFPTLIAGHPQDGISHAFDLIERIHGVIHRDVRKLYPDAEVPDIQPRSRDGDREMRITYASGRPMADLCEGMIMAALDHYNKLEDFEIVRTDSKLFPVSDHETDRPNCLRRISGTS